MELFSWGPDRMFKQNNKGRKCCDPVHQSQWEWAVRSKFRSEYELDEKIVKIITYKNVVTWKQ